MSDRDLAEAIYAELRTDAALDHAVERWYAQPQLQVRARLAVLLDAVTASALDRALARRQSEAARSGPQDDGIHYPLPSPERLALGWCPECGVYNRTGRCVHGYGEPAGGTP